MTASPVQESGPAATGEASHERRPLAWEALTPQESQIAHLAADCLSNKEIGHRLFLSHRTVASHLYRIFPKLGITTRAQLAQAWTAQSLHAAADADGFRARRVEQAAAGTTRTATERLMNPPALVTELDQQHGHVVPRSLIEATVAGQQAHPADRAPAEGAARDDVAALADALRRRAAGRTRS